MKQAATILLIILVFFQTFSRFVIEASYLINKGYISKYLCENKNHPELKCCGKCYLKKQLKKQDKEEQSTNFKKSNPEVQFFIQNNNVAINRFFIFKKATFYTSNYSVLASFPRAVFHPPAAV